MGGKPWYMRLKRGETIGCEDRPRGREGRAKYVGKCT